MSRVLRHRTALFYAYVIISFRERSSVLSVGCRGCPTRAGSVGLCMRAFVDGRSQECGLTQTGKHWTNLMQASQKKHALVKRQGHLTA